jgi:H+/Cl- antiporter ClcA
MISASKLTTILALCVCSVASAQSVTFYNNQHLTYGVGSWNMANINYYVVPGIMAGLFVFLFMMLVFLSGICQLVAVQTPATFMEEGINYGKMEDVE